MTFKPCNKGCNINIELRRVDQKWIPFEESGEKHDCPNSEYNKKKTIQPNQTNIQHGYLDPEPIIRKHQQVMDQIEEAKTKITPQEASHDEPIVLEAKEEMVYPQHRIEIVKSDNLFELQEQVNSILHQNDNKRHNHKGVTILLDDLESHEFSYVAVIHYEILQPREERMK